MLKASNIICLHFCLEIKYCVLSFASKPSDEIYKSPNSIESASFFLLQLHSRLERLVEQAATQNTERPRARRHRRLFSNREHIIKRAVATAAEN